MDNFPFARRTNWRQETNALNKALEELGKRGIDILDLTASNPTSCGFSYPEGMLSALNSLDNLHYHPDACGIGSPPGSGQVLCPSRNRFSTPGHYPDCQHF